MTSFLNLHKTAFLNLKKDPRKLSVKRHGILLLFLSTSYIGLLLTAVDDGAAFSNQSVIGSF